MDQDEAAIIWLVMFAALAVTIGAGFTLHKLQPIGYRCAQDTERSDFATNEWARLLILVTGGTGFLGRHLIPTLCRAGHAIRVFTRQPDAHPWLARYPRIQVFAGDLRDRDSVFRAAQGCRYVVHAGGYFRFWGDERAFFEINASGTENVMAAAQAAGSARVIHISSVAVIGQPDPQNIIDETYPPNPVEPYQESKLRGEAIALRTLRDNGLPVVILRPGAFYGPMGEYAFNRLFFRDPMRGIIMQINGGRYIIFPAYIGDVAQSILLALDRGQIGEIYNICGDWIAHRQAFDIVTREARLRWPRLNIPGWLGVTTSRALTLAASLTGREPFWPINLRSYVYNNWRVSNQKARDQLGFAPLDFAEGARRTIAWYRAGKPDHLPELDC